MSIITYLKKTSIQYNKTLKGLFGFPNNMNNNKKSEVAFKYLYLEILQIMVI
jgi:hypothetical protein